MYLVQKYGDGFLKNMEDLTKIADYVADGDEVKTLALPNEVVQNRALLFRFELPDAVSPLTLGISADSRALALAMRSISIFQKRHDY